MDIIFDHIKLFTHCDEAKVIRIFFRNDIIQCSHWFSILFYLKEKIIICLDPFYKTEKVDMSMTAWEINSKDWKLLHLNTILSEIDRRSCSMYWILNMRTLLNIREMYKKKEVKARARYWFPNEVMNMPNEKHWHKSNGKTYSNNNWKW